MYLKLYTYSYINIEGKAASCGSGCRTKDANQKSISLPVTTTSCSNCVSFLSIARFFSIRVICIYVAHRVNPAHYRTQYQKLVCVCVFVLLCVYSKRKEKEKERRVRKVKTNERALVFPRCVIREHISLFSIVYPRVSHARPLCRILHPGRRRNRKKGSHFFTSLRP